MSTPNWESDFPALTATFGADKLAALTDVMPEGMGGNEWVLTVTHHTYRNHFISQLKDEDGITVTRCELVPEGATFAIGGADIQTAPDGTRYDIDANTVLYHGTNALKAMQALRAGITVSDPQAVMVESDWRFWFPRLTAAFGTEALATMTDDIVAHVATNEEVSLIKVFADCVVQLHDNGETVYVKRCPIVAADTLYCVEGFLVQHTVDGVAFDPEDYTELYYGDDAASALHALRYNKKVGR